MRVRFFALGLALVISAGLTLGEAAAQSIRHLQSRDLGRDLRAVGRLDISGRSFCSGVLIDHDRVLTAAHCVLDFATGGARPVEDMRFLVGQTDGQAEDTRGVRSFALVGDMAEIAASLSEDEAVRDIANIARDIAVLTLDRPVRLIGLQPVPTSLEQPVVGEQLVLAGYGRSNREDLAMLIDCPVREHRVAGVAVLDCVVEHGNSGGPVLRRAATGWQVVGVISARGARRIEILNDQEAGPSVALAALLNGPEVVEILGRPRGPRVISGGNAGHFQRPGQ